MRQDKDKKIGISREKGKQPLGMDKTDLTKLITALHKILSYYLSKIGKSGSASYYRRNCRIFAA